VKSRAVVADLADVICRGLPPAQRNLTRVNRKGLEYWKRNGAGSKALGVAPPWNLAQPARH
jgi:hypothetical protein